MIPSMSPLSSRPPPPPPPPPPPSSRPTPLIVMLCFAFSLGPESDMGDRYCPTQYDELGCWFLTTNGVGWPGVFQDCEADGTDIPGVIDGQTYVPVRLSSSLQSYAYPVTLRLTCESR